MTSTHPGVFVVFEGGEGAGKTTQIEYLAAALAGAGLHATYTRQPGGTPVGADIRRMLLESPVGSLSPRAEALLYAADRAQHVDTLVRPALAAGEIVVSDRYTDSSIAYQAAGRDLPAAEIAQLSAWATGGLVPDLTVVLDIHPALGLARAARRGAPDRIEAETIGFHRRVRSAFLALAHETQDRYLVLDATQPAQVIADAVWKRVAPMLPVHELAGAQQ